jgi:uncharacterized protein (DUF488 family)
MKFYTIGVFNSTEANFFKKLKENHIDIFCDIRQRRSVRGSKYAYVNSTKLQQKLEKLGIRYEYVVKLAPTAQVRELQKQADRENHESITERQTLGARFKSEYIKKILDRFDFDGFIKHLEDVGAKNVVLFCVEEKATACHRSLVAERLGAMKYKVTHI